MPDYIDKYDDIVLNKEGHIIWKKDEREIGYNGYFFDKFVFYVCHSDPERISYLDGFLAFMDKKDIRVFEKKSYFIAKKEEMVVCGPTFCAGTFNSNTELGKFKDIEDAVSFCEEYLFKNEKLIERFLGVFYL